jgi:hypothetical protein
LLLECLQKPERPPELLHKLLVDWRRCVRKLLDHQQELWMASAVRNWALST